MHTLNNYEMKRAFTLIELLVVIAIIAILAAILFPVFAKAREKSREAVCTSNAKQIMLAYLQYQQDNDECCPIAFNQSYMYGPSTMQYNTTANSPAPGGACLGGVCGQQNGIQAQLQPYIVNWGVFQCPDDHGMTAAEVAFVGKTPPGVPAASMVGLTYAQAWGSTYQFTHEVESNPFATSKKYTGYATSGACLANFSIPGPGSECDVTANGEQLSYASYIAAGKSWSGGSDTGAVGYGTVTAAVYTRPSETRVMHEWNVSWVESPSAYAFHPLGEVDGYEDGHAKFLIAESAYTVGCDGVDWAWDTAGSCNLRNIQRNAD